MEPRYYSQVPFRGCSLMVKPQSSKLITRVRFPSSPRDLGSRRFRVEALSFSLEGMTGIPSACGFVSSRARNPHAPARHPLHKSQLRLPGIASGLPGENTFPRALGIFTLQPIIPSPSIHTKHPTKPRETGEYALSGNKPCASRCVGHLAGKQVN